MTTKIIGIIVLYNPQKELLQTALRKLAEQVNQLIVVDNSSNINRDLLPEDLSVEYVPLEKNIGIAAAQNIGIQIAQTQHPDFLFFLDQDSIIEDGLICKLILIFNRLKSQNFKIGAVGPRPINREDGKEYRGAIKSGSPISPYITEVTELINSASLIPIENIDEIGYMDERLFIDGVDHEWCWRGAKKGFQYFICEEAHLSHKLGEGDRRFICKKVAIPTPFRTYYQFRNYFYLLKRDYVPIYWKLSNGLKYLIKLFYFPLFVSPRKKYLFEIIRGIKDGVSSFYRNKNEI